MAWLRRHLVIIVGMLVMLYILAPNFVVIAFSFNNPAGRFNYQWNQFSFDAWTNVCGVPASATRLG